MTTLLQHHYNFTPTSVYKTPTSLQLCSTSTTHTHARTVGPMKWLRLVVSLEFHVNSGKEPYFGRALSGKRPDNLGSLPSLRRSISQEPTEPQHWHHCGNNFTTLSSSSFSAITTRGASLSIPLFLSLPLSPSLLPSPQWHMR